MKKIRLDILSLSPSPAREDAFILVLEEVGGQRRLPIVLGTIEAQAIALALEDGELERPMPHDLFKTLLTRVDYTVQEVVITELRNNVFFAKMTFGDAMTNMVVDVRPSDGIALGLRFGADLYIYEPLLHETHILPPEQEPAPTSPRQEVPHGMPDTQDLREYSLVALKHMLQKVVEQEDYEQAVVLRDEINRRGAAQGY
jgi:bifunctional DNase/RNase